MHVNKGVEFLKRQLPMKLTVWIHDIVDFENTHALTHTYTYTHTQTHACAYYETHYSITLLLYFCHCYIIIFLCETQVSVSHRDMTTY
jgi:hypothetical protein